MGLDMYLRATRYVSGYEHSDQNSKDACAAILMACGQLPFSTMAQDAPSITVAVTVGYWRKANAIHAWFVDNVQKGVDECQNSHVEREQLVQLLDRCKEVLQGTKKGEEALPTRSGFIFGNTEYKDSYREDLEKTVKMLEGILNNPKLEDWGFEYHSSW